MRTLDRYLLKQIISPFIYCITIFTFLYIVIDLFEHLDEILSEQITLFTLGRYYLNFIPLIFVQTASIAMLVSTVYVLVTLNNHNEITAMRTTGISILRIATPFLIAAFIVSILCFLVSDKVVPRTSGITSSIKQEKMKSGPKTSKLTNVTVHGIPNRLIYAKSYDIKDKVLNDVIILEQDKNRIIQSKIIAREAKWKDGRWNFYDVTIYRLDQSGRIKGIPLNYEEKFLDIREKPEDFRKYQIDPTLMSYRELKNYIDKFRGIEDRMVRRLLVDLYCKLSFPFTSFIIILIGIPVALLIKAKKGLLLTLSLSMVIGFIYYATMAISAALGKAGFIPPLLSAWLGNIIFGTAGILILKRL